MRVFIVTAMRNRADRNARAVMMYSSTMICSNEDWPGHWPGALTAGRLVIGSDPACAVRYERTSVITRFCAAELSSVSRNPR